MRRTGFAAFVVLVVATVAAFFVTQHLKVTTPLIAAIRGPRPASINPVNGRTCKGRNHRSLFVSFYLLHRSDDVDVYIVDGDGNIIRTLASNVHMQGGHHPVRHKFVWNGRTGNGSVAPDGTYNLRVALIHQGRSFLISNNSGPAPVTVDTLPPQPRVTEVSPALIPLADTTGATIHYTGDDGQPGLILVYRTDLPGGPRLVKSFSAPRDGIVHWNGTLAGQRPAPQGTYLIGLEVTDLACNSARFPAQIPPVPGTTAHAGITVRYLAALPPQTPVPAGSAATVYVDARQHAYTWTLRNAGGGPVLASGSSGLAQLHVSIPARGAGLYTLALRYGDHRTAVPIVAAARVSHGHVLVVVPTLTWQGLNPVDDDGDGIPNTLTGGYAVLLNRPLVDGLPGGWGDEVGLLTYLRKAGLGYQLTTDLALAEGTGPTPSPRIGLVLAGDEPWVPASLATTLRSYVAAGGRLLSLGTDSLRRSVTLSRVRISSPSAPAAADVLGAHAGTVMATRGTLILAGRDRLGLFSGTSRALRGYRSYQPFPTVSAPLSIASAAGPSTHSPAIIAYRRGRGIVIDIGLPGFGASLARNFDAQQLVSHLWSILSR